MTKVVKTERRRNGKGNVAVERSGLARNSSAGVNGSTVENGSSVENINPVENSSSVESISPVENNSPVGNTVSLTANRKYKARYSGCCFLTSIGCLNSTMPCLVGIM